jgi:murein DD-endopeptidase MepM/ murein hydrolase activator NlpD
MIRAVVACAAVSVAILCGGALILAPLAGIGATTTTDQPAQLAACGQPAGATLVSAKTAKVPGYNAEQTANATAIVQVGQQMKVPPRGWVIAIATALQESALTNLGDLGSRNDHDSLGLFQQRPSQGWGTPAQIMDPRYSSRKFFEHLLAVSGWEKLPLTVAAQRVQLSAYPDAYAKHEANASRIVNAITGGAAQDAATASTAGTCAQAGQVTASGWVTPAKGPVVSGFRTPDRPTHNGVDIAIPKQTAIHAASAGTVIKALCDPATAAVRPCDQDGDPSVLGCGWYVDIQHPDGVITRYCHQLVRPLVVAGQTVAAGQQIGWSGTSGNSSGPHLHFEVHLRGDGHASGAIDPIPFMRDHGAALGDRS